MKSSELYLIFKLQYDIERHIDRPRTKEGIKYVQTINKLFCDFYNELDKVKA